MTPIDLPEDRALQPGDTPTHPLAPWFEHKRRERRERYASRTPARPGSRRSAVLTIASNEPVFFPIWLAYYSRHFAADDIYVLDHDSDDGSIAGDGFVHLPVSHDAFDNRWMVATVERHQRELLERYRAVVVVDVDEIVAPDPAWGTLADYLERFDEEWVNCLGYEVIHMHRDEPALDPARPVLAQREHWFPNDVYNKPSIASTPISFKPGFHGRTDNHFNMDPDLRLIHLHRMDYELCHARHLKWRARTWAREDLRAGQGTHNRITEAADFERWFYRDSAAPGIGVHLEQIPSRWRTVV